MDMSIPNFHQSKNAYRDIYERYVDEASFLWVLRSISIDQPHYYISDIEEIEKRIEAQLDGLMTALDLGWDACEQALKLNEPGEVFTATVIAMRSHDVSKIQKAVEVGLESEQTYAGLISALGWLPEQLVLPWIERFLNGKDMNHKYLGLGICSVRRFDPGKILNNILQRSDCQKHINLYTRALRLIGELRRQDLMPALDAAMSSGNEDVKFWASWSAILLGQKNAVRNLQPFVFNNNPYQHRAIHLAFRVLPVEQARGWISGMVNDKSLTRAIIKATGVLGDPHAVNWLIGKMQESRLAKLASESFTFITGVDLERYELNQEEVRENLPLIPNDDPEDMEIGMDEDENLPWPDVDKVATLWRNHGQNFIVGSRYFMGRPITTDLLKNKLLTGNQRQRHAAALELALNDHNVQLPNTKARILAS